MPSPKMKTGSRMLFEMTVNRVRPMARRGLPEERMTLFRPKYRWVNTFPIRMTCM